jgi:hypothetical protein
MSLVEVEQYYRENESNIHSTILNSMHTEHGVFLSSGLLGTIFPTNTKSLLYTNNEMLRKKSGK